jgi:hypothetical protein
VVLDAREHLVDVGVDRALLVGALAAEEVIERGERGLVERAVGLVDVGRDFLVEVLGVDPDLAAGLLERLGAERHLGDAVALEVALAMTALVLALAAADGVGAMVRLATAGRGPGHGHQAEPEGQQDDERHSARGHVHRT